MNNLTSKEIGRKVIIKKFQHSSRRCKSDGSVLINERGQGSIIKYSNNWAAVNEVDYSCGVIMGRH